MTDSGPTSIEGNFVVLRADALLLLLPQEDVGVAEYLEGEPLPSTEQGVFRHGEGESAHALLALSPRLRPLARFPRERFLLTRLHAGGAELSLAWDEVRVLIGARLDRQPLPPAMRGSDGPIDGYVEHDGELMLCSTAERVLAHAMAGS